MTVHERDSRVVAHGCFSDGGDSILSAFLLGAFASEAACKTTNKFLWLAN